MSEEHIRHISLEEAMELKGETDWDRVRAQGDFEGEDEDDFELDWDTAVLVIPEPKQAISLRVDQDVLAFFKAEGPGYQTRMNAVLRAYMEAKKPG
ncbi:BrnA antitoxin family protein [Pseudooceanicola nanhaiensis]|uniref:BrnA antitoxin family protein n=1 Tax=Pseudooceanicola nanhaiensis TaxID=375761 RepID=UPI0040595882